MTFDHGRVDISTGSSFQDAKLKNQAHCHPFTQQERLNIDLIFPSNSVFENAIETTFFRSPPQYAKGRVSLTKLVKESTNLNFIQKYASTSGISLLSCGSGPKFSTAQEEEDIWCLDHRGVLTISVCKDTYEALGLLGKRVAFGKGRSKQGDGRHVISIPLYTKEAESVKIRARRENALKNWETRRLREVGSSEWNVLVSSEAVSPEDLESMFRNMVHEQDSTKTPTLPKSPVRYQKLELTDILIPNDLRLTHRPRNRKRLSRPKIDRELQDEDEEWHEEAEKLAEWVGLAGLGSSRLKANDRADSFVAVYEPPSPSRIGNVTHLRWIGFIGPLFVHSLIEVISDQLARSPLTDRPEFISLVSHACTWAPVSYIPRKAHQPGLMSVPPPLRDPTREVDESWCLIMVAPLSDSQKVENEKECVWTLMESVGKGDTRFG